MSAHEALGVLCDAQEISANATPSTNTIDLGQTYPKIGVGQHAPFLCIRTAVAPTAASNDTLAIELQTDADDGAGAPAGTWTNVAFNPLIGPALAEVNQSDARLAAAGAWIYRGQLPYDIANRHIRLMFRNGTSVGVFTIDAWLEDVPASTFRGSQVLFSNVGNPS